MICRALAREPTKAIREQLESDDSDLGFEYWLADRLKTTVGRMRREMPAQEFRTWSVYHAIRAQHMELEMARGG